MTQGTGLTIFPPKQRPGSRSTGRPRDKYSVGGFVDLRGTSAREIIESLILTWQRENDGEALRIVTIA
jgi:hypothetical protein